MSWISRDFKFVGFNENFQYKIKIITNAIIKPKLNNIIIYKINIIDQLCQPIYFVGFWDWVEFAKPIKME